MMAAKLANNCFRQEYQVDIEEEEEEEEVELVVQVDITHSR